MKVKKVEIGIKGLKESLGDFAKAWKKLEAGEKVKKHKGVYFESIDAMRTVLTDKRLNLLKAIKDYKPESIYELAKILDRDLKNVNEDVKLLSELGLVKLKKTKTGRKRTIPAVDYTKIILEIGL